MILDRIENWRLYSGLGSRVERAFRYLAEEWDPSVPDGRVTLDGDDVFALIQGYETRPLEKCRFEAHRIYLDIQFVFAGAEAMGWAPVGSLEIDEDYDAARDVMMLKQPKEFTRVNVGSGMFTLFYPADAHEPGIQMDGFPNVKKVVMKVRV